MLEAATLTAERHRFFRETKGGILFPLAGSVFWPALGVTGFFVAPQTWCLWVLSAGAVTLPLAILFFRRLVARLAIKSPLATLVLPAMLPVALSLALALAAFSLEPSLVPLVLIIGFASHWPTAGWLFATSIYSVHTVVRIVVAVVVWIVLPEGRFTWLPISIGIVYAGTALWVHRELRAARETVMAGR